MLEVGDLVELSAYGKKLKCFKSYHGDTGILIAGHWVMWSSNPNYKCLVNRRDVQKIKPKKSIAKYGEFEIFEE